MKRYAPVDRALARRFELADAYHTAGYARVQKNNQPNVGAEILQLGEAIATYAGPIMPMNRAVGLGMQNVVTPEMMDELEAFYKERNAVPQVDLCPLADESLIRLLKERGYKPLKFFNVYYRWLPADDYVPEFLGHQIETTVDIDLWKMVISEGFTGSNNILPDNPSPLYAELAFKRSDVVPFIARVQNEPAGGGAVSIRENVALLFSASARAAYRRRGVHSALLKARLDHASGVGCDVAMVATTPGTVSEKTIHRVGFRLAYTKIVLQCP